MLLYFLAALSLTFQAHASCPGYENCPVGDENKLNVHLVAHTHNDVGWLKTLDQYYYGANVTIQQGGVQYIIDSVIGELLKKPDRRFIYVEMAFFTRWWREQDDEMKEQVKKLVNEGRLEFILGGWCMNDEAATHYTAIIDQMTLGLAFINKTFGECARPRVAWQIDPFGHSREQASLFAQMGFDGLFFGRNDYQDKWQREDDRNMEGIWRASASLDPPNADLFTGVNQNGYNPPTGFCFDEYCADQPMMDDPSLEDYNVDEKIELFMKRATDQANHYATNHIMWTMGSDFQYVNANMWYKNLDKLIKYVNAAGKNVTTFYSTPSCYLNALNKANRSWKVKTDDFFPYAEQPHSFWTGYFTSRPTLKGYTRDSSRFLQACTQIEAGMTSPLSSSSGKLRRAMAVAQHHDAVSGTSKQHVADDYAKRLFIGREECKQLMNEVMMDGVVDGGNLIFCDFLNVSTCAFTQQNHNFIVILYNPIARYITHYVTIPIMTSSRNYQVREVKIGGGGGERGRVVESELMTSSQSLVFRAEIDAMSTSAYEVITLSSDVDDEVPSKNDEEEEELFIANEFYEVKFDSDSGLMAKIRNLKSGVSAGVSQNFYWYNSSVGNAESSQQSGAYVFRPNSSIPFQCFHGRGDSKVRSVKTSSGGLVEEVTQYMSEWCQQVVRLYRGKEFVEVNWKIGPIPIEPDGYGKEVITRYDTSIKSNKLFYTDSNGREMLERKLNYRPTWNLNQSEPVAGNYYPINTRAYIKDDQSQFTVLTDRSQGGASLSDGSLEIMLHRRVLGEDHKGVGEALNETSSNGEGIIASGKHYLILDTPERSPRLHRVLAEEIFLSPIISFANENNIPKHIRLMSSELPENIHLLTLAKTEDGSGTLLRLEHQFEAGEDQLLSQPVTVSLHKILPDLDFTTVHELTLGANAKINDVTRLVWKAEEGRRHKRDLFSNIVQFEKPDSVDCDVIDDDGGIKLDVMLKPMQIRTFLLK